MAFKIVCVVGARPNFIKIAPIIEVFRQREELECLLVHTGQHYDIAMKDAFFRQLDLPEPDFDLKVGSGTHAVQTGEIMIRFDQLVERLAPHAVLVVGDVNSTMACALVAAKRGIAVFHVEAGLRSFDRSMPEEINRVLTDQISELLFTTEMSAHNNLEREGIASNRIHFVGNVMIDSLRKHLWRSIPVKETIKKYSARRIEGDFALFTLHRPANVDDYESLSQAVEIIKAVANTLQVVFPCHPRTKSQLERYALSAAIESDSNIICLPSVGYLEMLGMLREARIVLTDSGGIQEETTALGVPCVTLRRTTERPVTEISGTNTIVGLDRARIIAVVNDTLATGGKAGRVPDKWDGNSAARIADCVVDWLLTRHPAYQAKPAHNISEISLARCPQQAGNG